MTFIQIYFTDPSHLVVFIHLNLILGRIDPTASKIFTWGERYIVERNATINWGKAYHFSNDEDLSKNYKVKVFTSAVYKDQ